MRKPLLFAHPGGITQTTPDRLCDLALLEKFGDSLGLVASWPVAGVLHHID
jgi:hypothetical protein